MNKYVNPAGPVAVLALVVLACSHPPEVTPGLADVTALVAPEAGLAPIAPVQAVYFAGRPERRSLRTDTRGGAAAKPGANR